MNRIPKALFSILVVINQSGRESLQENRYKHLIVKTQNYIISFVNIIAPQLHT